MRIVLGVLVSLGLMSGFVFAQLVLPVHPQAQAVIDQSKSKVGLMAQELYLIGEGKALLAQKNYDAAYTVASHVLAQINAKSSGATSLIAAAKEHLSPELQKTVAGLTAQAGAVTQTVAQADQAVKGLKGLWGTSSK